MNTVYIYDADGSVSNVVYHVIDMLYDGPRKELCLIRFIKSDNKFEKKVLKNIERFICE